VRRRDDVCGSLDLFRGEIDFAALIGRSTAMARVDDLTDGIYRISTYAPEKRISFNQFLIDDDEPALIHTGTFPMYADVRAAIAQVLDPSRLHYVIVPHFEADECGGMGRFVAEAPQAVLACSAVGARINLQQWDYAGPFKGMQDGDVLDLGRRRLRFWETPHVHHWDSLMVVEETTGSLFPSDLFFQPNEQPAIVGYERIWGRICADGIERLGLFGGADRFCVSLVAWRGLRRPGCIRCTAAACRQTCFRATRRP
jgi:glyoxylase-like metal-dependent hydrolase (beta-lactamase superfamily II)